MSFLPNPHINERFAYVDDSPSLTSQLPSKEADINTIVGRFLQTGVLPPPHRVPLELEDLTSAPNLTQLLQAGAHVQSAWLGLPQELRDKVGEPHKLFPFLGDPDNLPFLERVGIFSAEKAAQAPPPVVPPKEEPKA